MLKLTAEELAEAAKYPPSHSESGQNRYSHYCEAYGGYRYYAACIRTVNAYASGKPRLIDVQCNNIITNCRADCAALKMRLEEVKAKHAIYFRPPERAAVYPQASSLEENTSALASDGTLTYWENGERKTLNIHGAKPETVKPERKVKPKVEAPITPSAGSTHADLVNKMIKEESKNG